LAPAVRTPLTDWLKRTNAFLTEQWSRLSVVTGVRFDQVVTDVASDALSRWTDKSFACAVTLSRATAASLIVVPNELMQELIARVLGERTLSIAGERSLSPAEQSIAEFLVDGIVQSLQETWQGDASLVLNRQDTETDVRRTRRIRPTETVIALRSMVRTASTESHWDWLLTDPFLAELFQRDAVRPSGSTLPVQDRLEQRVLEMRARLAVRLGTAPLTGPQLAALQVGDVVVLDQRVDQPLLASIQGEPKFLGWAGRAGSRQAFEIQSEISRGRTG